MDTFGRPLDATLVDALSGATLTCADLGGLTSRELNALYLTGQRALANEQTHHAVVLFSLATELMPYQARFWRALGVCLHRLGKYSDASAAYKTALYLFPDHALTQVYLAETLHLLGDGAGAHRALKAISGPLSEEAQHRCTQIAVMSCSPAHRENTLSSDVPSIGPALDALMNAQELTLTDGRVLPLDRFDRDAVPFATNEPSLPQSDLSPKERTELTAVALGETGPEACAVKPALEPAEEPPPSETSPFLTSEPRTNEMQVQTGERTLAFRLRLSAVSLDDEITQARREPERTLTQARGPR